MEIELESWERNPFINDGKLAKGSIQFLLFKK